MLVDQLTIAPHHQVLDPACGQGEALGACAAVTRHVFGQGTSIPDLARAGHRLRPLGDHPDRLLPGCALRAPLHRPTIGVRQLRRFDRCVSLGALEQTDWDPTHWLAPDPFLRDLRGVPSRRAPQLALLLHMLAALKPGGSLATLLPNRLLSSSGRDAGILWSLVQDGHLEAVIELDGTWGAEEERYSAVLVRRGPPSQPSRGVLFRSPFVEETQEIPRSRLQSRERLLAPSALLACELAPVRLPRAEVQSGLPRPSGARGAGALACLLRASDLRVSRHAGERVTITPEQLRRHHLRTGDLLLPCTQDPTRPLSVFQWTRPSGRHVPQNHLLRVRPDDPRKTDDLLSILRGPAFRRYSTALQIRPGSKVRLSTSLLRAFLAGPGSRLPTPGLHDIDLPTPRAHPDPDPELHRAANDREHALRKLTWKTA